MSAQLAVERATGGRVVYLESVPVVETFKGRPVWSGIVEVFQVEKPPPDRAYGWQVEDDDGPQYVAVLGTPPIDCAIAAVRAWLVSKARK
jgi:hypothetical protein